MIRALALIGISAIGSYSLTFNVQLSTSRVSAATDIPEYSGRPLGQHPILAPCTRFEDRYQHLGFRDNYIEDWPEIYHDQVNRVIEEYVEQPTIDCTAENYQELLEPGSELLGLAAALPTWNDPDVPLSRLDTARVLLEYLRIYECSLMEYGNDVFFHSTVDAAKKDNATGAFISIDRVREEAFPNFVTIKEERIIARKALHRVLTLIGAFDRLRPLEAELECMQRFSLDVRNVAGITAGASACLPARSWNAKDALRDYSDTSSRQ